MEALFSFKNWASSNSCTCKVCLGFFCLLSPGRSQEPVYPRANTASRARGRCGLVPWWPLQPPRTARGGGCAPRCHAPRWGKAISIRGIRAYKINRSAPPQIICRVLNGILLTGKACIQAKGSKAGLPDWGNCQPGLPVPQGRDKP